MTTADAEGDAAPGGTLAVRRFGPRSFRATIVMSTIGIMTLAMVAVGLGIQLVLAHTARSDIDQVLNERADSTVRVIRAASRDRLTVPANALEPGMEVFDADGSLVAGSVSHRVSDAAHELSTTDRVRTKDGPEDDARLLGVPFTTPSGDHAVLVVTEETAPYERSERYALVASGALGVLVIAATALIALRVTRQALVPVTQMAERAAIWSEYDLTHRFDLGPPTNELAALGETLDHLLDRVASAIHSEQRLTAELAHELRTPLTAIQGGADLALLRGVADPATREDLEQISASARDMAGVITTLLDLARDGLSGAGGHTCTMSEVTPALVAALCDALTVEDRTGGSAARIAAPRDLVVRAVVPLLENARAHANSEVTLTASDLGDRVELVVSDDGTGVPDDLVDTLFEPGVTRREGGAGLGLGIARRVVRSFGGEISLAPGAGGATFVVSLPRR